MNEVRTHHRYWGKAEKHGARFHLLPYHCLDVAAVGHSLLVKNTSLRRKFRAITGLDDGTCIRWLTISLALHDIGKFSENFQNLRPDLLEHLQGKNSVKSYDVRHDSLGNLLWIDHLWNAVENNEINLFPEITDDFGDWQDVFKTILKAFTGHHGKPPDLSGNNNMRLLFDRYFGCDDALAANEFVRDLGVLFPLMPESENITYSFEIEEEMQKASWLMAGFAVLCDWIGSNENWFSYHERPIPLIDYWQNHALPQAETALREARVGRPEVMNENVSFAGIFPEFQPTPLQRYVGECPIAETPQLFILEDVTGSGKTEAALLLAGRLMAAGLGDGLFMALPTMATSNSMYDRFADVYRQLYAAEATPSLVLAHAARHLSAPFMASVAVPGEGRINKDATEEETASAQCSAWLADNRKRALLAEVGVGTIDQALLAILPARFQSLRLFGLVGHVLIVDEVHAYDSYMNKLLKTLLTFHAAFGGSAILLSATLPRHIRRELIGAFAQGLGEQEMPSEINNPYPLATGFSSELGLTEIAIEATSQHQRCVEVRITPEQDEVERLIGDAFSEGKCVCWIRNTVHDALAGYAYLKEKIPTAKISLFHARFAMGDRLEIENTVTNTFGKKSGEGDRKSQVLIATQVVEQSLDLDFDLLISDLAPMDLLIQRAGRLHRHPRDEKGNTLAGGIDRREPPTMIIHGPIPDSDDLGDWYESVFPKAAFVYPSHGCLWLTAKLLVEKGVLKTPDDSRELIEAVFSERVDEIPEPLRKRDREAEAKRQAESSLAHINMLKLDEGYSATINQWRDDTRTPTRLGGLETTVRLARWDGTSLSPWCSRGDFPWEMSQVNLRSSLVDDEAIHNDPGLADEVNRLKATLPDKGKWSVLVPLTKGEDGRWRGHAVDNRQSPVILEYDRITGVVVSEKEE